VRSIAETTCAADCACGSVISLAVDARSRSFFKSALTAESLPLQAANTNAPATPASLTNVRTLSSESFSGGHPLPVWQCRSAKTCAKGATATPLHFPSEEVEKAAFLSSSGVNFCGIMVTA
jgi:hypothetical protein